MRRIVSPVVALTIAALFAVVAQGAVIITAPFSGANEVPPNASPATGTGTFTLNDAQTQVSFTITYSGLIGGPVSGAHFHGPAGAGVNAGIIGDMTSLGWASPGGTVSGVWNIPAQHVANLLAGAVYFNIHTNDATPPNFPGGEIRANLVPEPSALVLVGTGIALLGLRARALRRRK